MHGYAGSGPCRELGSGIRFVHRLGPVGPPRARAAACPVVTLTSLQQRLLLLLAEGHTNQAIATRLGVARQTLDHHLTRLRALLGAPSRSAVVARAYHLGLLDPRHWPPRMTRDG